MTTYLEGFEQLAPGFASEDSYINAVKSAPSSGLVVDFALMKGRSRLAEESPYRLTFNNDPWGSFMMGFLLNLKPMEFESSEGWGIQRWRQRCN